MFKSTPYRYRFYREHKLISYEFFELEKFIAKLDFRISSEVEKLKMRLEMMAGLMQGHATFENNAIHALLRKKGSTVHEQIESEHQHHENQYQEFEKQLDDILISIQSQEQEQLGYEFYVNFRLFVCDNLRHFHQEETVIMPELQRLYSDEELRKVEFNTFNHMTPEQMASMISVLTPHLNPSDRDFFINEMKVSEPEKFIVAQKNI